MAERSRGFLARIRAVNERYRQGRIEMSFAVRAALMTLRVYLVVLVALMLYKFVQLLH
jgi:hypothetical protein